MFGNGTVEPGRMKGGRRKDAGMYLKYDERVGRCILLAHECPLQRNRMSYASQLPRTHQTLFRISLSISVMLWPSLSKCIPRDRISGAAGGKSNLRIENTHRFPQLP